MSQLVLSLFPGIDLFGAAFKESGFSVVQGGDVIYRTGSSCLGMNSKSSWAFREICSGQGLPEDFDLPGFTIEGKCKAVGNAVPFAMGRAIAKAVLEATEAKS